MDPFTVLSKQTKYHTLTFIFKGVQTVYDKDTTPPQDLLAWIFLKGDKDTTEEYADLCLGVSSTEEMLKHLTAMVQMVIDDGELEHKDN